MSDKLRDLIIVVLKLQLIENRLKDVGLSVEPCGDPNSVSDLLLGSENLLCEMILQHYGVNAEQTISDELFAKFYESIGRIESVDDQDSIIESIEQQLGERSSVICNQRLLEICKLLFKGLEVDDKEEAYAFMRKGVGISEDECSVLGISWSDVCSAGIDWSD